MCENVWNLPSLVIKATNYFFKLFCKRKKKMRLLICHSAIEHGFSMGKINMIVRREE